MTAITISQLLDYEKIILIESPFIYAINTPRTIKKHPRYRLVYLVFVSTINN